ncbi:glycosyltransferase family 2 protein [Yersinia mollaretii]|uniref:Glycosyltransferase family 2 protein n=1 Tax=Yersinia mollaretii TaxID=33060 RepID=A0AA44CJL5_YERMO|nr:glycosyltransferase [Yersinia mollaretii]NIL21919.1 glycosyltransferase family 2 protein [Yersinia mollaretii]CNI16070.1 glycosyltransferase [Yersinia mollaretii]CNK46913.1 glycosyltransferase [Yersinia enterocolitica]CQQ21278.1 glycosyltransferase [Yersinia mollaretii]
MNDLKKSVSISILICCYNSESRIKQVLSSLEKQKISTNLLEVIIIDNASLDTTYSVSTSYIDSFPFKLSVFKEPISGLMNARIRGIKEAKNDLIIFVDDDNLLDTDYCYKAHQLFSEKTDIAFAGGESRLPLYISPPTWFDKYSKCYAVGPQYNESRYLCGAEILWGAGLIVRREMLLTIINYDFKCVGRKGNIQLSGDDSELCYLLILNGGIGYYYSELKLQHAIDTSRFNIDKLLQVYRGFGQSFPILVKYRMRIATGNNLAKIKNIIYSNRKLFVFYSYIRRYEAICRGNKLMIEYWNGCLKTLNNLPN